MLYYISYIIYAIDILYYAKVQLVITYPSLYVPPYNIY